MQIIQSRFIRAAVAALCAAGLAVDIDAPAAHAANFVVVNTANAGLGSLRWAVDEADKTTQLDTITFADNVSGTIALQEPIIVNSALVVDGPGSDVLAIDGDGDVQLFRTEGPTTFRGLTMSNAADPAAGAAILATDSLVLDEMAFVSNTAGTYGGAVSMGADGLTIIDSSFDLNNARFGGAISSGGPIVISNSQFTKNNAQDGGALWFDFTTRATIADVQMTGNTALNSGGAISMSGQGTISNSTLSSNIAGVSGGGIRFSSPDPAPLEIVGGVVTDNRAQRGGGVHSIGSLFVDRSTIDSNVAEGINADGGGVYAFGSALLQYSTVSNNRAQGRGGGIALDDATASIVQSTVSSNSAALVGGGISIDGPMSATNLAGSSVVENVAGDSGGGISADGATRIDHSVVALNESAGSPDLLGEFDVNWSMIGDVDTATIDGDDNVFGDPAVGPLADNGGPTLTHLPLPASPLIDAGDSSTAPGGATDQRLLPRLVGDAVDIGSVEVRVDDAPVWQPLTPARLLDTRADATTVDDLFAGAGRRTAATTLQLDIAERGGVPDDAQGAIVNITAIQPGEVGFVTAHACNVPRPDASSLNFSSEVNLGNEVVVDLDDEGRLCLFTSADTHLSVDVVGYVGSVSPLISVAPARLLDTRPDGVTIDGEFVAQGIRTGDTETRVEIAGRGGIPVDAEAIIANVTAIRPEAKGFVTVHACESQRPLASSLNFVTGVNRGNEIIIDLDANGSMCLYTSAAAHLTVDVVAALPADTDRVGVVPARLLDTRPTGETIDGDQQRVGRLAAATVTRLRLSDRGGLPGQIATVGLNVTAVNPAGKGFITAWPCDQPRPNTSALNFVAGVNGGNEIIVGTSNDSTDPSEPDEVVCIFNSSPTDLTVDTTGFTIVPNSDVV